jgi:hypothetical protein
MAPMGREGRRPEREVLVAALVILRREFVGILRTRRALAIAILTVLATGILPIYSWPAEGDPMPFQAARMAFIEYQEAFFLALFLFVPAVAGSAITSEREAETLEILISSIPSTFSIALGKLLASTLFFQLLLVLTFPMVLKLLFLGGFVLGDFLSFFLSLSLFALLTGMVGIMASFRSISTTRALIGSYVLSFPVWFFGHGSSPGPLLALALMGLFLLARTARKPEASRRRLSRRERKFAERGLMHAPRLRSGLTEEILATARTGIPDGWNPVLVAGLRGETFGNLLFQSAVFWSSGLAILLAAVGGIDQAMEKRPQVFASILLDPLLLFYPAAGVMALIVERGPGRLDLLRISPITAGQVIRGKLYAMLLGGLCFLLWDALAIGIFWLAIFDRFHVPHIDPALKPTALLLTIGLIPAGVIFSVLGASMGFLAAALLRRVVSAFIAAYGLVLLLVVGFYLLLSDGTIDPLTGNFEGGHVVLALIAAAAAAWFILRLSMAVFERKWLRE